MLTTKAAIKTCSSTQVAFELLTAGSQLLAASDTQQARHLLGLITTLEGAAGPDLLRWLQPQRKQDVARCYELWAAVAALCRREQVSGHFVLVST